MRQPLLWKIYILLFVPAVVVLILIDLGDVVLIVNQHRTSVGDAVMPFITFMGDGIFYGIIALIVVVRNWQTGLVFAAAGAIQALVSFVLKRFVFSDMVRPKKFFEGSDVLHFVEGVDVHSYFSFPSGHTTSAFLLAGLLSLWGGKKWFQMLLLVLAILVAFSRVYLLQHFYRDVLFGSLIGLTIAYLSWYAIRPAIMGAAATR